MYQNLCCRLSTLCFVPQLKLYINLLHLSPINMLFLFFFLFYAGCGCRLQLSWTKLTGKSFEDPQELLYIHVLGLAMTKQCTENLSENFLLIEYDGVVVRFCSGTQYSSVCFGFWISSLIAMGENYCTCPQCFAVSSGSSLPSTVCSLFVDSQHWSLENFSFFH